MSELRFFDIRISAAELMHIKERANLVLRDRPDFNIAAAWTESVLVYLKAKELVKPNEKHYYSSGQRRHEV